MENTVSSSGKRTAGRPAADAGAVGRAELADLLGCLAESERQLARAVLLAGRLAGSGASERVEGLPLDVLVGLAGRQTGADRATLVAAGETLCQMPRTAALFADGVLSWGQVRSIARAARRMSRSQREWLDVRVAATAAEQDLTTADPDELVWAVAAAADELRSPREAERDDQEGERECIFSVQSNFAGGAKIFADLPDPTIAAPVIAALDAAAGPPRDDRASRRRAHAGRGADATDHAEAASADDAGDAPERSADRAGDSAAGDSEARAGRWSDGSRSRQYAAALAEICAAWLGGGSGRPARPLYVAHIDLSQVSVHADGTIQVAVRGDLPTISAAALERMAADADLRAVLFDGARPLAASKKVTMGDIPAATRFAVAARDQACRFPGSKDPAAHADVHHLTHRSRGGDHDPDNLALLSRRFHTLVHDRGWTLTLDPATGKLTARRGDRAWTSMPGGTRLAWPDGLDEPTAGPDPHAGATRHADCSSGRSRPAGARGDPNAAPQTADGGGGPPGPDPPGRYPRDSTLPF